MLQDNARPHVVKPTREKIVKLRWLIVFDPSYSLHLVPTDYNIFRTFPNHERAGKFEDENSLKTELISLFRRKLLDFHERKILSLSMRYRQQVMHSNELYIVERWLRS